MEVIRNTSSTGPLPRARAITPIGTNAMTDPTIAAQIAAKLAQIGAELSIITDDAEQLETDLARARARLRQVREGLYRLARDRQELRALLNQPDQADEPTPDDCLQDL